MQLHKKLFISYPNFFNKLNYTRKTFAFSRRQPVMTTTAEYGQSPVGSYMFQLTLVRRGTMRQNTCPYPHISTTACAGTSPRRMSAKASSWRLRCLPTLSPKPFPSPAWTPTHCAGAARSEFAACEQQAPEGPLVSPARRARGLADRESHQQRRQ